MPTISWKMTSKLTLNYGVRWDYYTPSREKYNHFSFIDLVGANPDGIPGRLAFAGNNGACPGPVIVFRSALSREAMA